MNQKLSVFSAATCRPRVTFNPAFSLCFSSRCPSACLCLKEAPKSPAALWEAFVLKRHSLWPFYPRRIASFLRACRKSVQLYWWPFQTEEEDKCRVCCSSRSLGLDRLGDALYRSVSPAPSTSSDQCFFPLNFFLPLSFSLPLFLPFLPFFLHTLTHALCPTLMSSQVRFIISKVKFGTFKYSVSQ